MHHIPVLPFCNNQMKGLLNKYMAQAPLLLNVFLRMDEHCPRMVTQEEEISVEWVPMHREKQAAYMGRLYDHYCLIYSSQKSQQLPLFRKPVNVLLLLNVYLV